MLVFWTALAALACAATASLVWPLLRNPGARNSANAPGRREALDASPAADDDAKRLAVYRDRRQEIEAEERVGRLSADEARLALDELLGEVDGQFPDRALGEPPVPAYATASPRLGIILAIVVAVLVPATALLVYDRVGAPGVVALDAEELRGEMSPAKLDTAIAELREKTARKANDGEAWAMLAEALRIKGDLAGSAQAFSKAAEHFSPPSARLLADYADVLVNLKGGEFGPEPVKLLERALAIDPREPKSLALMGAAQYRNGDLKSALITLRQLRGILPPESEQANAIGQAIARLESTGKVDAAPASASNVIFAGRIDLAPAFAGKLPPGTVLFVSARPAEGPRMPVAARRLTPERFPVPFELTDDDAMNPARKPSAAGALVIEARLSRSGNAMRASGDLFGVSPTTTAGSRELKITIDQVVP